MESKQVKSKLTPHVTNRINTLKKYLYGLATRKQASTLQQLKELNENLRVQPQALSDYAQFIKTFNEGKKNNELLETSKTEIENMHSMLKKLDLTQPLLMQPKDTVEYEDINNQLVQLADKLLVGETFIKERKTEMITKLDKETSEL